MFIVGNSKESGKITISQLLRFVLNDNLASISFHDMISWICSAKSLLFTNITARYLHAASAKCIIYFEKCSSSAHLLFLIRCLALLFLISFASCSSADSSLVQNRLLEKNTVHQETGFNEIWAYLMCGEESEYKGNEPVTDLCYFGAELTYRGELIGPKQIPESLKTGSKTRVHLVIANMYNTALLHFSISPDYPIRKELIESIADYSKNYDGIQIDFEGIHPEDRSNFISFLSECKNAIGKKELSVALRANTRSTDDVYDYNAIGKIVDRVLIMAYDEHWSTSVPGPIASVEWCKKVAECAAGQIEERKIVMGLPFYGRAWQEANHARALKYRTVETIANKKNDIAVLENDYPSFTYDEKVKVTVFFENRSSIIQKLSMYRSMGIRSVGFWRIGQNPTDIWQYLSIEGEE